MLYREINKIEKENCIVINPYKPSVPFLDIGKQEYLFEIEWKWNSAPYTPKIGNGLVQLIRMGKSIMQMWVKLQEKLNKYALEEKKFEVFQDVCACTLDIILKCAFSYNVDVQQQG